MGTIASKTIRAAMERKGVGQTGLRKKTRAPKSRVSDWIKGKRPVSVAYLPRVARALEIPMSLIAPRWLKPLLKAHEAEVRQRIAA